VTVVDAEHPTGICPDDITQPAPEGETGAVVEFTVSASDNCPGATASATPASGSFFEIGSTTVEVVAVDAVSLADTCYFNVVVTGDDTDDDGVVDIEDNCPLVYNPDQTDSDGDGSGDACDLCPGFDDRADADSDGVPDGCDICAGFDDLADADSDEVPDGCDNCPETYNPDQADTDGDDIGDACETTSCCVGRVGDANGQGGDEPTIGDIGVLVDALFISASPDVLPCLAEADVNQSGGSDPVFEDITIGDISILIDYLFITGPTLGLPDCL
jgi:hypothetical protein